MAVWNAAAGEIARFTDGGWRSGALTGNQLILGDRQVVGAQQPPIADPAGGDVIDVGARAALTAILAAMRVHGLIAL